MSCTMSAHHLIPWFWEETPPQSDPVQKPVGVFLSFFARWWWYLLLCLICTGYLLLCVAVMGSLWLSQNKVRDKIKSRVKLGLIFLSVWIVHLNHDSSLLAVTPKRTVTWLAGRLGAGGNPDRHSRWAKIGSLLAPGHRSDKQSSNCSSFSTETPAW